jgi:hypothetical protein
VLVSVHFCCVAVMLGRMQRVAVRNLRVVSGRLMITAFGMLSGFAMMFSGMLMVFRRLFVVIMNFVAAHWFLQCLGRRTLIELLPVLMKEMRHSELNSLRDEFFYVTDTTSEFRIGSNVMFGF